MRIVFALVLALALPVAAASQPPPYTQTVQYAEDEMELDATGGVALRGAAAARLYAGDVICRGGARVQNPVTFVVDSATCRCIDRSMIQGAGADGRGGYLYYGQPTAPGACPLPGSRATSAAAAMAAAAVLWAQQAAAAPRPANVETCPASAELKSRAVTGAFMCACPATPVAAAQRLWGSGVYTGDSHLCTAAVHSGAMPVTGGVVTVTLSKGCPDYLGSSAHGIQSTPYQGASPNSFSFSGQTC